jgi:hypothetical protein
VLSCSSGWQGSVSCHRPTALPALFILNHLLRLFRFSRQCQFSRRCLRSCINERILIPPPPLHPLIEDIQPRRTTRFMPFRSVLRFSPTSLPALVRNWTSPHPAPFPSPHPIKAAPSQPSCLCEEYARQAGLPSPRFRQSVLEVHCERIKCTKIQHRGKFNLIALLYRYRYQIGVCLAPR